MEHIFIGRLWAIQEYNDGDLFNVRIGLVAENACMQPQDGHFVPN